MRLALLPAAVLAFSLATPAVAAPPTVRATVEVSGRAGEVVTVRIDRTARLGNGGYDTPVVSPAAWSGVAVTRLDKEDLRSTYVHYRMHDGVLCPGRRCEPPYYLQPTAAMTDDGKGYAVLAPGTYGVALLGPAGAKVTATLHLRGPSAGRTALRTTGKAKKYVGTVFDPAISNGSDVLASRGFGRIDAPDRRVVDSLAVAFVIDKDAVVHLSMCATSGGRRDLDSNVGGVAPCADFSGVDILFGPDVSPVLDSDEEVGIAYAVGVGTSPPGGNGMGYEAEVAGVSSRIAALYVAVAF